MSTAQQLSAGYAKLAALSPTGYLVALHIRQASPLHTHLTMSADWVKVYNENSLALCDPLIAWSLSTEGAIRWSAVDFPDPFDVFGKAAQFGLRYGLGVSIGEISSRTLVSCSRGDREYTDSEIAEIQAVSVDLHKASVPPHTLTTAQLHALRSIASGDRHAAAAAKLGISESALKARLQSARSRLVARTTSEAIQKAKELRLL
ncbi:autoinducer binding domain-containing protein [Celeribacter sp.]|uniref:autoinducer binding domain-containing protein n=1 Tax=Celeribacter sp. TaxID=1890673 RepID=UPI003A94F7A8